MKKTSLDDERHLIAIIDEHENQQKFFFTQKCIRECEGA
jgi:hypothetical protein